MSKTRLFSIYLLKTDFNHKNSIKDIQKLEEAKARELPEGAHLFILDTPARPPWWRTYFGIEKDLARSSKGALIFLEVAGRNFAICFGNVFHQLNDYAYEYDFGLRVTLNSLDPSQLKSADMVSPGTARRKRTQVAISTDLTYLDFDGNNEIIKSLTGRIKEEHQDLFKNATGSSSLKIGMKINPSELGEVCERLLALYDREDYRETFPNIQNISPINDLSKIDSLNNSLFEAFLVRSEDVALSIPEIVDYLDDKTCCIFRAEGKTSEIFPDITIESLWDFLRDNDIAPENVDTLKKYQLILCDVDGNPGRAYSVMRSLVFEMEDPADGAIYHITDGSWYRADRSFVDRMSAYIDSRCKPSHLPAYNHDQVFAGTAVYSEGAYNAAVPAWNANYICLDQTDISPRGSSQVEPCDLYTVPKDGASIAVAEFYHIKISTRSAHLSHLFNQGLNAIELLKQEHECLTKMKVLVQGRVPDADIDHFIAPLESKNYRVFFGIISHKSARHGAKNLPLFSRLSLMRAMQTFELYSVECSLIFIEDQSPKKAGHKKYHEIEVIVTQDDDGKTVVKPCEGQAGFYPDLSVSHCPREVREALPGTQFRLQISLKEDGSMKSHHSWDFDVIEPDTDAEV